jgi:hypothetical protein
MSSTVMDRPGVATGSFPIRVSIEEQTAPSKFFAVPVIGYIARTVMLIPHIIALYIVGIVVALIHLVAWFPVLSRGEYPQWAFDMTTGLIRWATRVGAFFFGLTDQYPPFSLGSDSDSYPVQVSFEMPTNPGKLYAIPILGYLIRGIALIPHVIALYALGIVVGVMQLGLWFGVLFGGTYPDAGYSMVGGFLRWYARVAGYLYGLTDQYPPFRLAD